MKCARCGKEGAMNVMLPIGELTESGKIIYPNESKEFSVQSSVPLCLFDMEMASKGIITLLKYTDGLRIMELCDKKGENGLKDFEEMYEKGELTSTIEESLRYLGLSRKEVLTQKLNSPLKIACIIEETKKAIEKSK